MSTITKLTLFAFMAIPMLALVTPADGGDASPGLAVFEAAKCQMCHAVEALGIEAKIKVEKMKGPDLSKAVDQEAETLTKYLKKEAQINDQDHKKEAKLSDEDMSALVKWLKSDKS